MTKYMLSTKKFLVLPLKKQCGSCNKVKCQCIFMAQPCWIVNRCQALKAINMKQYLSTRNFLVDNIYFVIKSRAALFFERKEVFKTSVKLRQSNIKPFK
jgi:hypothetical protein